MKEKQQLCLSLLLSHYKAQTIQSSSASISVNHPHGLKYCSVGDCSHYSNDERQMRAALSVRESVHFLPPDFIKRRFSGLSLEDHCNRGAGKGQQECFVSVATSIAVRSVSHAHTISACLRYHPFFYSCGAVCHAAASAFCSS